MQVSYQGVIFTFTFEMVDKILKLGSMKAVDCLVPLFTKTKGGHI